MRLGSEKLSEFLKGWNGCSAIVNTTTLYMILVMKNSQKINCKIIRMSNPYTCNKAWDHRVLYVQAFFSAMKELFGCRDERDPIQGR